MIVRFQKSKLGCRQEARIINILNCKEMKKFLPYVLVLIVVSGAVGYFMYNKPHNETKGATSDVIISPADLLKAYETDEAAADLAYLDKILEVEGIVKSIHVLDQGSSLSLDAVAKCQPSHVSLKQQMRWLE